ncbi:45479_t:CDS:1 [Gigaspora margarita]|uniref:45479_t:CDS:1 n=1 Tax=Gigaspora margarita TaxID=4874 RepID=A0ABN7WBR5_GIGMA|nr:45479_t:CDS:1 [Gigaspora margarita]
MIRSAFISITKETTKDLIFRCVKNDRASCVAAIIPNKRNMIYKLSSRTPSQNKNEIVSLLSQNKNGTSQFPSQNKNENKNETTQLPSQNKNEHPFQHHRIKTKHPHLKIKTELNLHFTIKMKKLSK